MKYSYCNYQYISNYQYAEFESLEPSITVSLVIDFENDQPHSNMINNSITSHTRAHAGWDLIKAIDSLLVFQIQLSSSSIKIVRALN